MDVHPVSIIGYDELTREDAIIGCTAGCSGAMIIAIAAILSSIVWGENISVAPQAEILFMWIIVYGADKEYI